MLPGHDLSIEQGTEKVPDDGLYYVVFRGEQKGRFRSLKQATKSYDAIKATLNIVPALTSSPPPLAEVLQREMETRSNKSLIWEKEDFIRVERKTGRRGRVR